MEGVINTIGRRKCAVARVYMKQGSGAIIVNGRDYKEYFPSETLQYICRQAFETVGEKDNTTSRQTLTAAEFRDKPKHCVWVLQELCAKQMQKTEEL